jgi:beta-glucosidase
VQEAVAGLDHPTMEQKGFCRIALQPGEEKTVVFDLPVAELAFNVLILRPVMEPGLFHVRVGTSSHDIRLR